MNHHHTWRHRRGTITLDQPRIMGVINTTPDSFSDAGLHLDPQHAAQAAQQMINDGAHLLDVGGESTRPGAQRVPAEQQIERVVPAIRAIRDAGIQQPISIDTTRAEVARAAIDAGADIINDVAAATEDHDILRLAAESGAAIILMHRLRPPDADRYSHQYTTPPDYGPEDRDLIPTIQNFLHNRVTAARNAGIDDEQILLDPGVGFGKSVTQNLAIIRAAETLNQGPRPILCAVSRKSFIGKLTNEDRAEQRVHGSTAVAVAMCLAGVRVFRVHDVRAHAHALSVAFNLYTQPQSGQRNPKRSQ